MRAHSSRILYTFMVLLVGVSACTIVTPTEVPPALLPEEGSLESTATPAPATKAPSLTPTPIPASETLSPTRVPPTDTPFFNPPFTQTAKAYKTRLDVNLPNLGGSFLVRADTPLTISDVGSDGRVNTCTISKSGRVVTRRQVPVVQPSNTFVLARGNYVLNCGRPNVNATITSE